MPNVVTLLGAEPLVRNSASSYILERFGIVSKCCFCCFSALGNFPVDKELVILGNRGKLNSSTQQNNSNAYKRWHEKEWEKKTTNKLPTLGHSPSETSGSSTRTADHFFYGNILRLHIMNSLRRSRSLIRRVLCGETKFAGISKLAGGKRIGFSPLICRSASASSADWHSCSAVPKKKKSHE